MTEVEAWRRRHPGVHAGRGVRLWLALLAPAARRLGGVRPDVLTGLGALASLGALVPAPRTAAGLVVAGGVLDGLDGMVAVDPSPRGRLLDHGADRIADVALAAGLARAGAPRPLAAAALVAVLGHERARGDSVVVTPGERPVRIALGALGILGFPRFAAGTIAALSAVSWRALRSDRRRSGR